MAAQLSMTRLVYVADSDADMVVPLAPIQALVFPLDLLIRVHHDRKIDGTENLVLSALSLLMAVKQIAFALASRCVKKARSVTQRVSVWVSGALTRQSIGGANCGQGVGAGVGARCASS